MLNCSCGNCDVENYWENVMSMNGAGDGYSTSMLNKVTGIVSKDFGMRREKGGVLFVTNVNHYIYQND